MLRDHIMAYRLAIKLLFRLHTYRLPKQTFGGLNATATATASYFMLNICKFELYY